ncbi:MAG TPA: type II CAAX endopeptidase family protein [Rhizomicrobium sp.]|jgi:membrane protease YdiL (CAAX protease family)|nr:type II CAAX endopeptidase family protein [Rhizomicrobium sp.]
MTTTRRLQIVVGLLLALGLPFCHLDDLGRNHSGLGPLAGGEVLWWVLFAGILLYVLFVEREALSSIGFRRPGVWDIVLGILAGIVIFMGTGVIFQVVLPALHMSLTRQMSAVATLPLWFRILNVTRAALVEETAFRGYGFERLKTLTTSPLLAGAATWVLFTAAHLSSWGWAQVIIAAYGGLVLTGLYMWRRNLWANIVAHWLTDGAAFLLLPLLTRPH